MSEFRLYLDGDELPKARALALEKALGERVSADIPLALEVTFVSADRKSVV